MHLSAGVKGGTFDISVSWSGLVEEESRRGSFEIASGPSSSSSLYGRRDSRSVDYLPESRDRSNFAIGGVPH
ncbi:hypothetical protein H6P81_018878 [Aristolochia fimbriata]|uniref:Uncharacterized protein n=1 Tax=Aristolochia fimbriata TaxID=158543 RepID=A0AAV7E3F4_ARIFI|nr:hypothetical protein H6P81_018878 [Aristolochia fimbriata]